MERPTEEFIEIIKNNSILWDLTNPNYKNIKMKAKVWKNISESFGMPAETCKKKWKSLRDCCSRDLSRKPVSGQGTEEPESGWKYKEQMEFVREQMRPRSTKSNIERSSEEVDSDFSTPTTPHERRMNAWSGDESNPFRSPTPEFEASPSPDPNRPGTSTSSSSSKRRKVCLEATFVNTMESVQEFLRKPRTNVAPSASSSAEPDEDELFCQSLVKKLKKFPREMKNDAKLEMLRFLNGLESQLPSEEQ